MFADDMLLYVDNPKDSSKKLVELINKFSKVAGYKINIQKSVVFLHTNNKTSENKIKQSHSNNIKNNKIIRNKFY